MKLKAVILAVAGALGMLVWAQAPQSAPNDGKLRIIIFGAHPDDAEYRGAGVAMKWAKAGHHVKLVSCHQRRYRPLADRRRTAGGSAG